MFMSRYTSAFAVKRLRRKAKIKLQTSATQHKIGTMRSKLYPVYPLNQSVKTSSAETSSSRLKICRGPLKRRRSTARTTRRTATAQTAIKMLK